MALEAFRRIQIGKEASQGGGIAAADKVLAGTLTMTPRIDWNYPVDERNSLAERFRQVQVGQGCSLRYEGAATYEQLIYFFAMCLKGGVTPQDLGDGVFYWTFKPNLSSVNTQDSFTFEYGDNTQEFESEFVVAQNLEFSIPLGDVVTLRADLIGHFPVKSTFTGSLDDPTVHEVVANKASVYIDNSWANRMGTIKSTLLTGGAIRLPSGLMPVKYADGDLDFSKVIENRRHFEMDLDLAMGANAVVEYDAYVAGTARAIAISFTGSHLIGGATYNTLVFEMYGKYTSEPELFGARDGENIVRLTFSSFEDTLGNEFQVRLYNGESAL